MLLPPIPPALNRIHLIEPGMRIRGIPHRIKQVKLGLRTKETRVRNTRRRQILLSLQRHRPRIPAKRLLRKRIHHRKLDIQRFRRPERIHLRRR